VRSIYSRPRLLFVTTVANVCGGSVRSRVMLSVPARATFHHETQLGGRGFVRSTDVSCEPLTQPTAPPVSSVSP
jgi:hypothetical protein